MKKMKTYIPQASSPDFVDVDCYINKALSQTRTEEQITFQIVHSTWDVKGANGVMGILREVDLLIADISYLGRDWYYYLGVADALGVPFVIIDHKKMTIPHELSYHSRVQYERYNLNYTLMLPLIDRLQGVLNGGRRSNPPRMYPAQVEVMPEVSPDLHHTVGDIFEQARLLEIELGKDEQSKGALPLIEQMRAILNSLEGKVKTKK